MALGTGDRGTAVIRAAQLDAEFERLVAMATGTGTAGQTETLGTALAAFRKCATTWREGERAARPAGVRGTNAPAREWSIGSELGRSLCAFADQPDAMGQTLPLNLLARLTEELAPGADTSGESYGAIAEQLASALVEGGKATPIRASLLGESARRAAVAEGRAGIFERALLANDTDLAEEHLSRFELEEGIAFEPAERRIMLRYALRVLADVAREDARRERGQYPAPELDPLMAMPIQSRPVREDPGRARDLNVTGKPAASTTGNQQEGDEAPAQAEQVPSAKPAGFMQASAAAIARIKARTMDQVGPKQIRDYNVARRLFGDICGDLNITAITKETCQDLREQLGRVPNQHGKGGRFRNRTAREAILLADEDDAVAIRTAIAANSDPEDAPRVPRMSAATINKHLTSLQTLVGEQLDVDRKGQTPFLAVRFSKSYVKANATFDRRQLEDDRLTAIFHGPAFTGFSDNPEDRFLPGNTLIRDARYWVPLVALYGGERLEELLELWPDDVVKEDGVELISIGAIHDRKRTQVKSASSVRKVPVHSVLKELGFLDYVRTMRQSGSRLLFPGFKRAGPDKRFGHNFSQWWTGYRLAVDAYKEGQDFHSMRHGVNTRLLASKVPETIIRTLLGHSHGNSMTGGTYNSGLSHTELADAMELLRYPELDVELLAKRAEQLKPHR
ncbi:site-specific integrase [Roseomonas sp. SSH11]|uniref:Site-specific integrase n=2 Tax=Pararoseomonas baculiformis TaxID=2820812 RepID=A0ABS4AHP6_9PROT|nr:site-specific integrase [Pararoseomonas baculiformis]